MPSGTGGRTGLATRLVTTLGAVLVASCGGGEKGRGDAVAPDFELITYQGVELLGGERVRLSDVVSRLDRPVVLNFWAAQCPPCRFEMPAFQRVHERHGDRLLVLGVDMGAFTGLGTEDGARRLLRDLKIGYPVGTISDGTVIGRYRILGLPATYFLKSDGEIHRSWTGILDEATLESLVTDLLGAEGEA